MAPKRLGMMRGRGLLIYGHHAVVFYIFLRKLVSGKLENVYVGNRNVKKSSWLALQTSFSSQTTAT